VLAELREAVKARGERGGPGVGMQIRQTILSTGGTPGGNRLGGPWWIVLLGEVVTPVGVN